MAYDEPLAQRVRTCLAGRRGLAERRMFGGLCFTVGGRMCCGVLGADLVVRVTGEEFTEALREPGARPMDFTGRPMKGFLFVDRRGHGPDESLAEWVERGVTCARSQPPAMRKRKPAKKDVGRTGLADRGSQVDEAAAPGIASAPPRRRE